MTLEEAIQLANNGDTEAMFQLGQYYWSQEKNYQEAQKWYLAVRMPEMCAACLWQP